MSQHVEKATIYESNGRRKIIGTLDHDFHVFKKDIKGSKHILRKLNAIGIDAHFFKTVLEPSDWVIMVHDTENGKHYQTIANILAKHGEYRHYKPHRAQIFLALRYWAQSGDILSADRIAELLKLNKVRV